MLRVFALAVSSAATAEGPCDILGAAGNPCVAAHSTVRALYAEYNGPLYTVMHSSGTSANISTMKAGGFANVKEHETICPKLGDCVIEYVIDQSPYANHLGKRHKLVDASRHKITVGDNIPVYGMYFDPGYGYHVDKTRGVPTGNDPESMYAVMTGKRYNGGCCFDYGNSETNDLDDGCGTMEAIYFGSGRWHGNSGDGNEGPWVGADLEQGMYYGGGNVTVVNHQNKPLTSDFVSLSLKGREDGFTLKGGDATKGVLTTMYDGPRPDKKLAGLCGPKPEATYQPMRKQGAIILATGGDFSNSAEGNFYEGFMAVGYASGKTDEAVQANIVAVGYKVIDSVAAYTELGGDCYGNNIDYSKVKTANDCAARCDVTSGCAGFSLDRGGDCYTKSASCAQVSTGTDYKFYRREKEPAGIALIV